MILGWTINIYKQKIILRSCKGKNRNTYERYFQWTMNIEFDGYMNRIVFGNNLNYKVSV